MNGTGKLYNYVIKNNIDVIIGDETSLIENIGKQIEAEIIQPTTELLSILDQIMDEEMNQETQKNDLLRQRKVR